MIDPELTDVTYAPGSAETLKAGLLSNASNLDEAAARDDEMLQAFDFSGVHGSGDPLLWPHITNISALERAESRYSWASRTNTALMDETTFHLARGLIEGSLPLSPLALLDLSSYVNTFVLRDFVVRNKWSGTRGHGEPQEKRTPLDAVTLQESSLVGTALWSAKLWEKRLRAGAPEEATLRLALARSWRSLLGPAAPAESEQFCDDATADRLSARGVVQAIHLSDHMQPGADLKTAVAFSNLRALYNLEFARELGITYDCSVTRVPARRYFWAQGRIADSIIDAVDFDRSGLVKALDQAYREKVRSQLAQREQTVAMPVLLAAVLARIDRLDQFDEELDALRTQASPMRRRLAEIDSNLRGAEGGKEIAELMAAFGDDTRIFGATMREGVPSATAAIGVVLSAATGQPAWITAILALIAAKDKFPAATLKRLNRRLRRRDLWFVTELGGVCDSLRELRPRLELLWRPIPGLPFGADFDRALDRAQALRYA